MKTIQTVIFFLITAVAVLFAVLYFVKIYNLNSIKSDFKTILKAGMSPDGVEPKPTNKQLYDKVNCISKTFFDKVNNDPVSITSITSMLCSGVKDAPSVCEKYFDIKTFEGLVQSCK